MSENTAIVDVRGQIEKMKPQFQMTLPKHISPDHFARVAITAINRTPALVSADRKSLLESCQRCAEDGLLPDGKEAALVVYKTKIRLPSGQEQWTPKVQYMPMVAGIRKKIHQTKEIPSLVARGVYENDDFEIVYGDDERIVHKPAIKKNRGAFIGVYAIATYNNGTKVREWMGIEEINKVRDCSKSPDRGPWSTFYDEMAKKTVIRRLSKSLPFSAERETEIRRVLSQDDALYELSDGGSETEMIEGPTTITSALDTFAEDVTDETVTSDRPDASSEVITTDDASSFPSDEKKDFIKIARERGRKTARDGKPRTIPKHYGYHHGNRGKEADAFYEGYDETKEEAQ